MLAKVTPGQIHFSEKCLLIYEHLTIRASLNACYDEYE